MSSVVSLRARNEGCFSASSRYAAWYLGGLGGGGRGVRQSGVRLKWAGHGASCQGVRRRFCCGAAAAATPAAAQHACPSRAPCSTRSLGFCCTNPRAHPRDTRTPVPQGCNVPRCNCMLPTPITRGPRQFTSHASRPVAAPRTCRPAASSSRARGPPPRPWPRAPAAARRHRRRPPRPRARRRRGARAPCRCCWGAAPAAGARRGAAGSASWPRRCRAPARARGVQTGAAVGAGGGERRGASVCCTGCTQAGSQQRCFPL